MYHCASSSNRIIPGYPWLEAFNPTIDWNNGTIEGSPTEIKTLAILEKEAKAYFAARKLQKTTVAQQMAEKYYKDHKKEQIASIPEVIFSEEYQQHAKVFSKKEVEHFPPS